MGFPRTGPDWIETLPDPALIADPNNDRVEQANKRLLQLLGSSADAVAEQRVTRLFRGQVPQLVAITDEALVRGEAWSRDLKLVADDDRVIHVELSLSRFYRGEEPRVLILLRDLTKLRELRERHEINTYHRDGLLHWKRIETLFREIERENHLILEAVGEGIYGVDAEGRATFINSAAERMLGWSRDDLLGRAMHSVIHHTHCNGRPHQRESCPIYRAFRDGAVHRVNDDYFWCRDGTGFPVEYTSTPILDNGQLVGAVVVFRDISERRRTEDSLKQALEEVETLRQRLEMENAYLQEEIRAGHNAHEIVGCSAAVAAMIERIELVAPTDANVLVTGESGTGKELVARAIHNASDRSERPMIRVNCAAIPADLFESEFFGHVKGAFTGAVSDRVGRFELADGGTLFLDEVGEIPLSLQSKLLRVLQEQTFERLGETRTRHVDVRVIAATNRDLRKEISAGRFREDLYFRLNVFPIESAPLRERPEDIPPLAQLFLRTACRKFHREPLELSCANVAALKRYSWPGNVRELENVIERQVIVTRGRKLHFDLPEDNTASAPVLDQTEIMPRSASRPMTEDERQARERANMINALSNTGGKISGPGGAAELLRLKPTTLASRLKRYGIEASRYRAESCS
ncbi:sigma 54-interacting transcriptional regulator [Marinobacter sp.]|uniref:sigma 54-interacting transcriptional regulator n=1 Tax=Marinobacter sp. TaxID=50741 RepID=UPI0025BD037D|nr:sigma 54-interacting transcriptional regulator [Marinobacter sp.]